MTNERPPFAEIPKVRGDWNVNVALATAWALAVVGFLRISPLLRVASHGQIDGGTISQAARREQRLLRCGYHPTRECYRKSYLLLLLMLLLSLLSLVTAPCLPVEPGDTSRYYSEQHYQQLDWQQASCRESPDPQ